MRDSAARRFLVGLEDRQPRLHRRGDALVHWHGGKFQLRQALFHSRIDAFGSGLQKAERSVGEETQHVLFFRSRLLRGAIH